MPERPFLVIRVATAVLVVAGTVGLAATLSFAGTAAYAGTGTHARTDARAHTVARAQTGPGDVSAPEAAIANASTGTILWSRELNTERPIASITKVMTALVVLRSLGMGAGGLSNVLTVPSAVTGYVDEYDASSAGLHPGDRLTVNQLLYAMLLPSGADAAYTLADAYGPGLPAFVAKMNATAREFGMTGTDFSNPDGLPYPSSRSDESTAADLIKLGRAAMRYQAFRAVVASRTYRISAGDGHHAYYWKNLNPLLGVYPGSVGIKTGWTPAAGHCLLFESNLGGVSLIGVNLDSTGSGSTVNGNDATAMLNWAFDQPNA
jgi:serine-type D-Ala-D-Ala carboxypeptidase (penicillin-binding protein 5/6)